MKFLERERMSEKRKGMRDKSITNKLQQCYTERSTIRSQRSGNNQKPMLALLALPVHTRFSSGKTNTKIVVWVVGRKVE